MGHKVPWWECAQMSDEIREVMETNAANNGQSNLKDDSSSSTSERARRAFEEQVYELAAQSLAGVSMTHGGATTAASDAGNDPTHER